MASEGDPLVSECDIYGGRDAGVLVKYLGKGQAAGRGKGCILRGTGCQTPPFALPRRQLLGSRSPKLAAQPSFYLPLTDS